MVVVVAATYRCAALREALSGHRMILTEAITPRYEVNGGWW